MLRSQDIIVLLLCIGVHLSYRYRRQRLLPLPPGPARLPVIGNAHTIPLTYPHIFYKELGEKLGSKILYLEAFGRPIIVINDIDIAKDLLEKRSALYSSRPQSRMVVDIAGFKSLFGLMPYGDEWRTHRRIFQQYFSPKELPRFEEIGLDFIRRGLLTNFYIAPNEFDDHVRNVIGGLSLSITYGLPIQRQQDPFVRFAEDGFKRTTAAAAPGKYWVNIVAPLKYMPEWMPGAGFKKEAKELRKHLDQLMEEPFHTTAKAFADGTALPSFVADGLDRYSQSPDREVLTGCVKETAVQVFGAVSQTTGAGILTFILGMLMRPDFQSKAQQQVDLVVGPDRLPDFSDIPQLPYISAIMKEVLRWNTITPLGVPHLTSQEDVYMGYYIPKNCTVMANTYAILHDDNIFPEPENFKPERFIRDDGGIREDLPDPEFVATFGFGRRICPGSHIARSIMSITMASLLYLFDFSPAVDAAGNPVQVKPQFTPASLNSEPLPFPCKVTPREGKNVHSWLQEYIGTDYI